MKLSIASRRTSQAMMHAADLQGQGVVALLDGAEDEAGHVERALAHQDEVVPELAEFVVEEALHGLVCW